LLNDEQGEKEKNMETNKRYCSRTYWENYINSIIDSIQEDKDTIIDMLVFGRLEKAEIVMCLNTGEYPNYKIKVCKIAEKSPFGEENDE
jgi:hypothetical protein